MEARAMRHSMWFKGTWSARRRAARWLLCLGLWVAGWAGPAAAAPSEGGGAKRILLLFSNDRLLPANVELDEGLRSALGEEGRDGVVEIFAEFLDAVRFPGPERAATMETYLRARYAPGNPDVVVAMGDLALEFLMKRREQLFVGVPVAFVSLGMAVAEQVRGRAGVCGLPIKMALVPMLEAMLRIRPKVKQVVLVSGAEPFDLAWGAWARKEAKALGGRLQVQVWSGRPYVEVLRDVARLPEDALVFYLSYLKDADGRTMVPAQAGQGIFQASTVPVLAMYETYVGRGALGGYVTSFKENGVQLGGLVRRLLAGETAAQIGVLAPLEPQFVFDAPVLARWGISERQLPAGSTVKNRVPTLWEAQRGAIIAGLAVMLLQAGLIARLLAARARRRKAEGALRRSEQRFAGVFRSSPTAIGITRQVEGTFVDVNPSWEALFGLKREAVVGQSPQALKALLGADWLELFQKLNQEGNAAAPVEQEVRLESGRKRWVNLCRELAELDEGPCYITLLEDVTEHRVIEDARRSLAHAARLALLGELTASIAHEINQPLGAILSNAEAAELLLDRPHPPWQELRQILGDIRGDDLRASQVIQRVRALVGKRELQALPVCLNAAVQEVLRLVAKEAQRRGVQILQALKTPLPEVMGDRVQIEQVLLNLILNGMDAMRGTALRRRVLRVQTLAQGTGVQVRVEDGGHGIDPAHLDQLFDSFFTTKENGMGLGLALARSIAEAHQGSIAAANRPEGGAVFTLKLGVSS